MDYLYEYSSVLLKEKSPKLNFMKMITILLETGSL